MLIRHAHRGEGVSIAPCYGWLFAPPGSEPVDWSTAVAVRRLEDTISGDSSTVLLATDGETIQGFATVYVDIVSVRFGQRAWIEDLAVAPAQRSIGVGRTLLDQAKEWAKDNGATHIELESGQARHRAHEFYRREQPRAIASCFVWGL